MMIAQPASFGAIEPDGTLDPTFHSPVFDAGAVQGATLQADGKIVISGYFEKVNGALRKNNARLFPDGTVDQSYQADDKIYYHLLAQPNGKILAWSDWVLTRLNEDGSVDAGFDIGQRLYNPNGSLVIRAVLMQPNGKLVVCGNFTQVLGNSSESTAARDRIARFNSDGTLDGSFNPQPGINADYTVLEAVLQKNGPNAGKIVFTAGSYDSSPAAFVIKRLNSDGSLDTTFIPPSNGDDGWSDSGLYAQSDDRILISSSHAPYSSDDRTLVRLTEDGALDNSFSADGFKNYREPGQVNRVMQLTDGKLLVAGQFHSIGQTPAHGIARLQTNGAIDTSFSGSGISTVGFGIFDLLVRPDDNRIFIDGIFGSAGGAARHNMAWLNPDGSASNLLAGLKGATDRTAPVYAVVTQPDGKIIVGGGFTTVNGAPHSGIVLLNKDGSINDSLGIGVSGDVYAITIQPDEKILVGGTFRSVDGVARGKMARLNLDSTLDLTFDPNVANGVVYTMVADQGGNVFLGGSFTSVGGAARYRLAKVNAAGVLDQNFVADYISRTIRAITPPDGNGKIVIGGEFSSVGNVTARRAARLDAANGKDDGSFSSGLLANVITPVYSLSPTNDGKYFVGNGSTSSALSGARGLVRLNADGSLDSSFSDPTVGRVTSLLQTHDKIIAADTGGDPNTTIRRVTNTGQIDQSFASGTGGTVGPTYQNIYLASVAAMPDGRILLGGTFESFNGEPHSSLVRFTNSKLVALKVTSITNTDGSGVVLQGMGTPNTVYEVQASTDLAPSSFSMVGTTTSDAAGLWRFVDSSAGSLTKRLYRLTLPATSNRPFVSKLGTR